MQTILPFKAPRLRSGAIKRAELYSASLALVLASLAGVSAGENAAAQVSRSAPSGIPGRWRPTGSLVVPRLFHTASLLQNGKVLIAGGFANGFTQFSSELYDPATKMWSATGDMAAQRQDHVQVSLADGRALVAGGDCGSTCALSSAETYNPATGVWTLTRDMTAGRKYLLATLLQNGQVLVVGGEDAHEIVLTSAELYNPATGKWTATGSTHTPRASGSTLTVLQNGQVLVAGGSAPAELYDPATGIWTETGSLITPRGLHTATLLNDGEVLVCGGYYGGSLASAELYDPATGMWRVTGSLLYARDRHTATLLPNGQVLVASGERSVHITFRALAQSELYDPATGSWTRTGSLYRPRVYNTATLLPDGTVLSAGGSGADPDAAIYSPGH